MNAKEAKERSIKKRENALKRCESEIKTTSDKGLTCCRITYMQKDLADFVVAKLASKGYEVTAKWNTSSYHKDRIDIFVSWGGDDDLPNSDSCGPGCRHDKDDCFSVLGVTADATVREIKRAYKKLAAVHHPDKGGDNERMSTLSAALEKALNLKGTGKHNDRRSN